MLKEQVEAQVTSQVQAAAAVGAAAAAGAPAESRTSKFAGGAADFSAEIFRGLSFWGVPLLRGSSTPFE